MLSAIKSLCILLTKMVLKTSLQFLYSSKMFNCDYQIEFVPFPQEDLIAFSNSYLQHAQEYLYRLPQITHLHNWERSK